MSLTHNTVLFTNIQYDTVCLWRRYSIMIQYRSQTHSMILYVCKQYCIIILYPLLKHRVWYCMFVKMIQYPLLMAIIQVDLGQKRLAMLDRRLKIELYNGAHGQHTAPCTLARCFYKKEWTWIPHSLTYSTSAILWLFSCSYLLNQARFLAYQTV